MKIRYFADTDTAMIEFSGAPVSETREISENLQIDLDEKGNIVNDHRARARASLSEVSFLRMEEDGV